MSNVWANIRAVYFLPLTFLGPSSIAAGDKVTDTDFGTLSPGRITKAE